VEYPDNSHASRETPTKPTEDGPKVEKVVTGTVTQRKRPLSKKFKDLVVGGDSKSVGRYILFDILIPAFKDTITDVVSQGVERMVYGEARSTSRRTGTRPGGANQTYTTYSRFSQPGRPEPRFAMTAHDRRNFNFQDIIIPTRDEANAVLSQMFEILNQYDSVSVADLYSMCDISPQFTDRDWGWKDIRGAGAQRVTGGYLLDLPRPEPLK
jgi:hypothetical protein